MSRPVIPLSDPDAISLVRFSLERRVFDGGVQVQLAADQINQLARRHATLFEAESFAEQDCRAVRQATSSMLGAFHAAGMDVVTWIHGDGKRPLFRFGVVSTDIGPGLPNRDRLAEGVFEGFLQGTTLRRTSYPETVRYLEQLQTHGAAGVVVGIPSDRSPDELTATLDLALDALSGAAFDIMVQCTPVPDTMIDLATENLSLLANQAELWSRATISAGESETFSENLTKGVSEALGSSETKNWSSSRTVSEAMPVKGGGAPAVGAGAGLVLGAVAGSIAGSFASPAGTVLGAKLGGMVGAQLGSFIGGALVPPVHRSEGNSSTQGETRGTSHTVTLSRQASESLARGLTRQVTFEVTSRQARALREQLEAHLERLRSGRGLGLWIVSVHVFASDASQLSLVANTAIGALRGEHSHLEPPRLMQYEPRSVNVATRAVGLLRPPLLRIAAHPLIPGWEQPVTQLTSPELACWLQPPSRQVTGILVRSPSRFSRYVPARSSEAPEVIPLGPLLRLGRPLKDTRLTLDLADLCKHCFVAGTTGSGKTNTVRVLLRALSDRKVPFVLLEPAKSEYGQLFDDLERGGHRPLRLAPGGAFGDSSRALEFNPFAVPPELPLGRHVEALKILLRACFAMQESLPQILERVLFKAYEYSGHTDFAHPVGRGRGFPTFAQMLKKRTRPASPGTPRTSCSVSLIEEQINALGYEQRVRDNLVAAMTVRLESFVRGTKGLIFSGSEMDWADALRRPCFVELSDITEPDIRRFLVGALLLRLYAEREAERRRLGHKGDQPLQHLLVLEEAHHFLREETGSGPGAELVRQSNSMLSDAFAELRAYGQGILVADQAPAELAPAVLRNTGTKVLHRLLYEADCRAAGDAIGLDDEQRAALRHLAVGEAVVFTPSTPLPVCCRISKFTGNDVR